MLGRAAGAVVGLGEALLEFGGGSFIQRSSLAKATKGRDRHTPPARDLSEPARDLSELLPVQSMHGPGFITATREAD